MVAAVRRGQSQRRVARRFKVSLRAVPYWLARAGDQPLPRVDWRDRSHAPAQPPHQTDPKVEQRIVQLRQQLRHSAMGFVGAQAIADVLAPALGARLPSVRTIGRVLARHGQLDGRPRVRQAAPPPGWYLPELAAGRAELAAFDFIEDLCLEGGRWFDVLTARALWGPVCGAWVGAGHGTTAQVLSALPEHGRRHGRPTFAQFDNDRRFHGPHRHPDTLGRVVRLCLQAGVTPIFAPPAEHGLQNLVESFNHLWRAKVWDRFEHPHRRALAARRQRFVDALIARRAAQRERTPPRRAWPRNWELDPQGPLRGRVVFVRRTDEQGRLSLLGHCWPVAAGWPHRRVRAEVDLDEHCLRCYRLRRREPRDQPLLATIAYRFPRRAVQD